MEPENDGFQKESPFPRADFQIPCYISGVAMLSKGKLLVSYQKSTLCTCFVSENDRQSFRSALSLNGLL